MNDDSVIAAGMGIMHQIGSEKSVYSPITMDSLTNILEDLMKETKFKEPVIFTGKAGEEEINKIIKEEVEKANPKYKFISSVMKTDWCFDCTEEERTEMLGKYFDFFESGVVFTEMDELRPFYHVAMNVEFIYDGRKFLADEKTLKKQLDFVNRFDTRIML